jgi:hypothetical protein
MPSIAVTKDGVYTDAEQVSAELWEAMKAKALTGDFLMPCCRTSAVLKTSAIGTQFFAHLADECRTAPETAWHKAGKALIATRLNALGVQCFEEMSGGQAPDAWEADTYFRAGSRTVVVELQRSYQHLRDYIRRQERYKKSGVECYWLTRLENFRTLAGSTGRLRMKREWGGKFPPGRLTFWPLLPDFPVAILALGDDPSIQGVGLVSYGIDQWLQSIIEQRYLYDDGAWLIK